jgi:hypothetical protein
MPPPSTRTHVPIDSDGETARDGYERAPPSTATGHSQPSIPFRPILTAPDAGNALAASVKAVHTPYR